MVNGDHHDVEADPLFPRICTAGASLRRLALVHDWHVSETAYAEALSRLIDAHRALAHSL